MKGEVCLCYRRSVTVMIDSVIITDSSICVLPFSSVVSKGVAVFSS